MAVMQLPATQLLTFDGSPLQYWSFIYSFEEIVGSKYVDDSKKLNTLFSYCTGKAAKSIECCKFMNAEIGYRQALQILKQRFGDPLLIKEYWIEQLTMGVKLKPRDADALQNLADEVLNCSSTFIAMGLNLDEFYDKVSMIVSRLPSYLMNKWSSELLEFKEKHRKYPSLDFLALWLKRKANELTDPF